jgi:hypothetical protein
LTERIVSPAASRLNWLRLWVALAVIVTGLAAAEKVRSTA